MSIFKSGQNVSPRDEQQSIDVYKGIGSPGEAGPKRQQGDVTVPNDVVHAPKATSRT